MKITVRQLKQLIKEQVDESYERDNDGYGSPSPADLLRRIKSSKELSEKLGMTLTEFAKQAKCNSKASSIRLRQAAATKNYDKFINAIINCVGFGYNPQEQEYASSFNDAEDVVAWLLSRIPDEDANSVGW